MTEKAIGEARELLGVAETALGAARAQAPRIVASLADGDIQVLVAATRHVAVLETLLEDVELALMGLGEALTRSDAADAEQSAKTTGGSAPPYRARISSELPQQKE